MNFPDILYYLLILLVIIVFFGLLWVIGGYLLAWDVDRRYRACPNCQRKAAGTIVDTEVQRLRTQLDRTQLTLFRVTRERVTDHYQCDYCQHTWTKTFEREERQPVEGASSSNSE